MIKFYRGLRASYNQELHGSGIYFATDTFEILMNGNAYVGAVANAELSESGELLTITKSDGTTLEVNVGASGKYTSKIEDKDVAMTTKYGDYVVGTKVSALEGKTYDELFDGILFPSVNPTKSGNPSVSGFALNPSTSPVELGTAVASISEAGLNKATWTTYNNNMAYAGDITSTTYTFTINGTTYSAISDLSGKNYSTLGNLTYKAVVAYAAGAAPKNNKGVEVASLACPAGSVEATRTVNVTAPWYASTVTAGVLTKLSLISWTTSTMQAGANGTGFEVKPHTAAAPQMFKLPRKATSLQMYSTVSKSFETVALSDWELNNENGVVEQINGVDQTYYTYTYKGEDRGAVKLIVKF